jgi:hypothetical protein
MELVEITTTNKTRGIITSIVLKTRPVRWFDQKKPEPMPSPVFYESLVQLTKNQKNCIKIMCFVMI